MMLMTLVASRKGAEAGEGTMYAAVARTPGDATRLVRERLGDADRRLNVEVDECRGVPMDGPALVLGQMAGSWG